jgi:hypothetical protein
LMLTSLDRVMQTVALTLTLVIPLLVLMRSSDMREDRKSPAAQPAAMNTSRAVKQESQLVISPQ